MSDEVVLDWSYTPFQDELLNLQKEEQIAFLRMCKKIRKLTWDGVYQDKGLNWEEISTKKTSAGDKVYSIRFSKKYRAVVLRDKNFIVFLSIHVDHGSAYK